MAKKTDEKEKEELQQMYIQHQMIKQQLESYAEQSMIVQSKISELNTTIDGMKGLGKVKADSEMWVSMGSQIFAKAEIKETEKVIIDLGAGVFGKKPVDDATKILESRRDSLISTNNQIILEANKLGIHLKQIEPIIQKLMEKIQS